MSDVAVPPATSTAPIPPTARPSALPVKLEGIPASLRAIARWVVWKHHYKQGRQRWIKLPFTATGSVATVDNPATWSDFETAYGAYAQGGYAGVGFVFTGEDNLIGGDFDHCFDPNTGELSETVIGALSAIEGYWERSPSGRGLHVITRADLSRAYKDDRQHIELYPQKRFFAMTGQVFKDQAEVPATPVDLQPFIDQHFPVQTAVQTKPPVAPASAEGDFFRNVNNAALQALGAWVPVLFPQATPYQQGGFRVASASLGRHLEEDISLVPDGIVDFGVADMGDARAGKRTPIDLVIEWHTPDPLMRLTPREAAFWLCEQMGVAPASLGWGVAAQRHPCTESGNAARLLDRYGAELMFVPELSTWYRWSGVYWKPALSTELEWLAQETIRALPEEAAKLEVKERAKFLKFCLASQKLSMFTSMVRIASSHPAVVVPLTQLDAYSHLLGVGNGAIDLRTGELVPPDRAHRMTVITPVEYDPDAQAPLFEQTLHDIFFGDQAQMQFLQRLIGYALFGQPDEDVLVIPHGSGSNGKSTLLGTIRDVLGQHARSASAETFLSSSPNTPSAGSAREDILRLRGARFVYVNEPEENSELRENLIKSMTGGEPMPARGLWSKTTVEVNPTWVVFVPTNHKPIVKGEDHAIWRRLMLVPFMRNFDEDRTIRKDVKRAKRLMAEAAGILAWCVRGALTYQREGLQPTQSVIEAHKAYREDMDLLSEWLEMCCEQDKQVAATNSQLWTSWEAFAKSRGVLRFVSNSHALGRRLVARGFNAIRNKHGIRGRGYAGLRVREAALFET